MSSLTLLEGSLREVYQAPSQPLVSNFSGSKLYQASAGWGRIWSWIFSFLDFYTGKNYRNEKLAVAIEKTRQVFHEQFGHIKEHAKKYQEYLRCKEQNLHVDEAPYYACRRALLDWLKATSPYTVRYLLDPEKKKQDPLNVAKLFSKEELRELKELEFLAPLLRLETDLQTAIPLQIFCKISRKQELKNSEAAFLKKWLKACDEESCISPGEMDRALRGLEKILSNFDLSHLRRALIDHGFQLFNKKDAEHIAWRNSLKAGSKIETSQGQVTLGERLCRKDPKNDSIQVYAIAEDPNKVVWIGVNSVIPRLKEAYRSEEAGIPSAQCYEIDKEGRFAICERLHNALADIEWQTVSNAKLLTREDQDILTPVAKLLNWCIQLQVTPQEFSPEYLMFNTKGALRFARLCYMQEFSHPSVEDFILKTAKGNQVIYDFLMRASGMLKKPEHQFYRKVVEMALKKETVSLSDMGAKYSIVNSEVIDRAEALYKEVSQMQSLCEEVIKQNYSISKCEKKVQLRMNFEIFQFYLDNSLSGRLRPKMETSIIERTVEALKLKKIRNL